jgi:diguanylate cyclase (GGDEF)-like protein
VLEGVALALAQNLKAINEVVPNTAAEKPLNALGGGMRSSLWREILAAAYGRELQLMERLSEATACGAAMCAAVGTGMCSSFQQAALRFAPAGETVAPQQEWQAAMAVAAPRFNSLYLALKPEFAHTAEPASSQHTVDSLQRRIAELEQNAAKMEELALTDELTGLPNRRAFHARLLEECRRARRYGRPLSLAMLDLDNFKRINDDFGHAKGDAALRTAGLTLASSIRSIDMAARIGGEEFAVLFPETPQEGAHLAASRIVQRLLQGSLPASAGVAQLNSELQAEDSTDEEAANTLLSQADSAMFRAKRAGGSRASY